MLDLMMFCKKIEPFVLYYKRLIKSYNNTAHNILKHEIKLILPQIPRKQKCGIITTLVSSFVALAYEGISSFLHHKWNKALHKAVRARDSKTTNQCNKLMQLENSMLMYGVYNGETLEKLIKTVCHIQHYIFTWETICRTTKLMVTQITLCKYTRFTTLFHKFITLFKNSTRWVHCLI